MTLLLKKIQLRLVLLIAVFCIPQKLVADSKNIDIQDFNDPRAENLWQAFADLESGKRREPLRIIQLGDSHTAGDYLTGRLRKNLQSRYGNAGIGWVTPGYVLNQRSSLVLFRGLGKWQMLDSKLPNTSGIFPLGGLINISNGQSILDIKAKEELLPGSWQFSIWHRGSTTPWRIALPSGKLYKMAPQDHIAGEWNLSNIAVNTTNASSLRLLAPQGGYLGGVALDRIAPGVTLDSLGINGARASLINKWHQPSIEKQLRWRNPELIILAYGTNEAFETDIRNFAEDLRSTIRFLKKAAPRAAILIVGAPASAKTRAPNARAGCKLPLPPNLVQVMNAQRRVAKQEKTLYWDWSAIMGGKCGAVSWLNSKPQLMRKDMIHFSAEGYDATADALFSAINKKVKSTNKFK